MTSCYRNLCARQATLTRWENDRTNKADVCRQHAFEDISYGYLITHPAVTYNPDQDITDELWKAA